MHIVLMLPSAVEFENSYGNSYRRRQEHISEITSIPLQFHRGLIVTGMPCSLYN